MQDFPPKKFRPSKTELYNSNCTAVYAYPQIRHTVHPPKFVILFVKTTPSIRFCMFVPTPPSVWSTGTSVLSQRSVTFSSEIHLEKDEKNAEKEGLYEGHLCPLCNFEEHFSQIEFWLHSNLKFHVVFLKKLFVGHRNYSSSSCYLISTLSSLPKSISPFLKYRKVSRFFNFLSFLNKMNIKKPITIGPLSWIWLNCIIYRRLIKATWYVAVSKGPFDRE